MGQATVELPDPLQQDNAAAPSGSADDLLAQLAGEEIDRILADTEQPAKAKGEAAAEPVTSEPAADTASGSATADAQQTIGDQLDALFHTLNEPTAEEQSQAPEPSPEPTAAELDAQLADQAKQAIPGEPAAEETPVAAGKLAEAAAVAPVETLSAKAAAPPPAAAIASREAEESKDSAALTELLKEDSAETPLILKPLVWLNAPFASLSSGAKNGLGVIAIVTLLNAVAILIYVLVFRKH